MWKSLTYYYEDEDEYYFINILWNELNSNKRGFFFFPPWYKLTLPYKINKSQSAKRSKGQAGAGRGCCWGGRPASWQEQWYLISGDGQRKWQLLLTNHLDLPSPLSSPLLCGARKDDEEACRGADEATAPPPLPAAPGARSASAHPRAVLRRLLSASQ